MFFLFTRFTNTNHVFVQLHRIYIFFKQVNMDYSFNKQNQITRVSITQGDGPSCIKYKMLFNQLMDNNKQRADYVSLYTAGNLLEKIMALCVVGKT